MADDPVGILGDVLGDMANRLNDYTAVWQEAAARNAAEDYNADAVIADVLKVTGLMTRDAMTIATTALNALGAIRVPSESKPSQPDSAS